MKKIYFAVLSAFLSVVATVDGYSQTPISGTWNGTLDASHAASLRIVVSIADDGKTVALDSPDQGVFGIKGFVKYLSADSLRFTVPKISASYAASFRDGRLIGIFRQGAAELPLQLVPGDGRRKRPQTPQPPFPYTTREVTFTNPVADAVLAGTLTLPDSCNDATPVVLMVTGSGLQNRDEEVFEHKPFAVIADYLARHGIASLRYDDRGFGASTGNPLEAKTTDFAQDAAAGVAWLRDKGNFRTVGVLGHSEGTTVAFILGAGYSSDTRPDFIVAMGAPTVRGDSILADQSATAMRGSGAGEKEIADYCGALLKYYAAVRQSGAKAAAAEIDNICAQMPHTPVYEQMRANLHQISSSINPWLEQFVTFRPADVIGACSMPVLALYGGLDRQVSPGLNMPRMKELAPHACVTLFDGLNHLFQHAVTGDIAEYARIEETISEEVLAAMADFILENVQH